MQEKELIELLNGDTESSKDYTVILIAESYEKAMGHVLDLAKISEMSERSFEQFKKTTKKYFYDLIRFNVRELKAHGKLNGKKE